MPRSQHYVYLNRERNLEAFFGDKTKLGSLTPEQRELFRDALEFAYAAAWCQQTCRFDRDFRSPLRPEDYEAGFERIKALLIRS